MPFDTMNPALNKDFRFDIPSISERIDCGIEEFQDSILSNIVNVQLQSYGVDIYRDMSRGVTSIAPYTGRLVDNLEPLVITVKTNASYLNWALAMYLEHRFRTDMFDVATKRYHFGEARVRLGNQQERLQFTLVYKSLLLTNVSKLNVDFRSKDESTFDMTFYYEGIDMRRGNGTDVI